MTAPTPVIPSEAPARPARSRGACPERREGTSLTEGNAFACSVCGLLVLAVLFIAPAGAQVPGNCELGRAEGLIDVGDVYAKVFNTGSLFFGNGRAAAYLVPREPGNSAIYAAGLWVGGLADGELRVAGATYNDFEFWPGPLDPSTGQPRDPADCSGYDRIWRVSRHDIAEYYLTGEATADLRDWPHHLGAPVIDGDGDPTNYDLSGGDQPALSGDQMLWWVMNDVGNVHSNTLTPPIGLEVQVSAFGFGDGPDALRQATFYRYTLINRAARPLEDAYVMLWSDPDLGDAGDDFSGSDTLRHVGYFFNADDQDGSGTGGTYGPAPPALGFQIVQGPVGLPNGRDDDRDGSVDEPLERAGMTASFGAHRNMCTGLDPWHGVDAYNRMRGRWLDGAPIEAGGYGCGGSFPATAFMFAGDPVLPRFWSQRCLLPGGACQSNQAGDQHVIVSTGPFRLPVGASQELLFAIPYGRGTSHLDSILRMRAAADVVRSAQEGGYLNAQRVDGWPGPPPLPTAIQLRRPAPNPFAGEAVMSITLPAPAAVRVALVDILGREVAVLADGPHDAGANDLTLVGASVAPGVYVVRVWVNGQPAGALPVTRR